MKRKSLSSNRSRKGTSVNLPKLKLHLKKFNEIREKASEYFDKYLELLSPADQKILIMLSPVNS